MAFDPSKLYVQMITPFKKNGEGGSSVDFERLEKLLKSLDLKPGMNVLLTHEISELHMLSASEFRDLIHFYTTKMSTQINLNVEFSFWELVNNRFLSMDIVSQMTIDRIIVKLENCEDLTQEALRDGLIHYSDVFDFPVVISDPKYYLSVHTIAELATSKEVQGIVVADPEEIELISVATKDIPQKEFAILSDQDQLIASNLSSGATGIVSKYYQVYKESIDKILSLFEQGKNADVSEFQQRLTLMLAKEKNLPQLPLLKFLLEHYQNEGGDIIVPYYPLTKEEQERVIALNDEF